VKPAVEDCKSCRAEAAYVAYLVRRAEWRRERSLPVDLDEIEERRVVAQTCMHEPPAPPVDPIQPARAAAVAEPSEPVMPRRLWDVPVLPGALCREVDTGELWFPEKGGSNATAKQVCQACPVREACLQWAVDHDERYGVWGGLSERERRQLRREVAA
jgi:hypothetical protein